MRLEESKPDYIELKRKQEEKVALKAEKKRKRELRWNSSDGFFAKDMSLITDNNVNTRSGKWKRGRYGRAIAVMRLRKNDGTRFVYDPMNYKNNLEKLYNINVRMKHPRELPMSYEEYEDEEPDQDAVFHHHQQQQQQHSHIPPADIDGDNDSDDLEPAVLSSSINHQTKDKGEEKRLAAIERRSQEQQAKKDLMKQTEKERKHISFGDSEKKEPQNEEELNEPQESEEPQQPKDGAKWMFDSDSEEDDLDIRINPVMEGEKGKERLELQSRYQGDDRFKLDEAFIDDDEDEMARPTQAAQMDDAISKDLGAEKNQAMDVLRSMFGDIKVMTQTKPDTQWSSSARFDPDADDASNYLVQSTKTEKEEDDDMKDTSSTENDDDEVALANRRPESAMPEVSSDKHYSVNVNLKPLFGAEEEPFKLFGGGDDDEDDTPGAIFGGDKSYENLPSSFIPKTAESQVGLGLMFFLHSDNPSLVKRSCYSYDPNGIFQRNEEESETYEANWRTGRSIISDVLKNRERNALRKHRKQTGRDLK
ncbi:unnamed protein product [Absidia cylindrospora]